MITFRRFVVAPVLVCVATTSAACSSTVSGHAPGPAKGVAAPTATPSDAAGLAAFLHAGSTALTSAHLTVSVSAAGHDITGQGDETLRAGKMQAMDLTEDIPGVGALRLIIAGGSTFVKLPADLNQSGKPWILVSPESTNPVVQSMASSLQSVESAAAVSSITTLTDAASSVKVDGPDPVNGRPATHYSVVIAVAKLPDTMASKQQLLAAGLQSLPVELWVDGNGRPVKMTEQLTVEGQSISTTVTLGSFDAPVSITAPPADQVGTS